MMIDKQGKIIVDGVEYKGKYDRNEEHGAVVGMMGLCTFWEIMGQYYSMGTHTKRLNLIDKVKVLISLWSILKPIVFDRESNYKITISRYTKMQFGKEFSRGIAFDPPEAVDETKQNGNTKENKQSVKA